MSEFYFFPACSLCFWCLAISFIFAYGHLRNTVNTNNSKQTGREAVKVSRTVLETLNTWAAVFILERKATDRPSPPERREAAGKRLKIHWRKLKCWRTHSQHWVLKTWIELKALWHTVQHQRPGLSYKEETVDRRKGEREEKSKCYSPKPSS